jgi:hypothetical protein
MLGVSLAVAVLCTGCGRGRTVDVDGSAVPVTRFTKAVAALCSARVQARTDIRASRRIYLREADAALRLAVRALGDNRQVAAAHLEEARKKVASDFAASSPSPVVDDLGELTESARAGLARLAITTSPCKV